MVCRWTPDFRASDASITNTIVWVRLPEFPYPFFSQPRRLKEIGDMIDSFIKVDEHTEVASKGCFARIAVEIDLKKPLLPKYLIRNSEYNIEYEGIRLICYHCGVFGHHHDDCPASPTVIERKTKEAAAVAAQKTSQNNVSHRPEQLPETGYGPWMLVNTHRRQNLQRPYFWGGNSKFPENYHNQEIQLPSSEKSRAPKSSFLVLADLEEDFTAPISNHPETATHTRPSSPGSNLSRPKPTSSRGVDQTTNPLPIKRPTQVHSVTLTDQQSQEPTGSRKNLAHLSRSERQPLALLPNNASNFSNSSLEKPETSRAISTETDINIDRAAQNPAAKLSGRRSSGDNSKNADRGHTIDRGRQDSSRRN